MSKFKDISDLHKPQPTETTPLPQYRATISLCYGDLIAEYFPQSLGEIFCKQGEVTELYWPLRSYPDRIELLIEKGFIERVQQPKVYIPEEKPTKAKATIEE